MTTRRTRPTLGQPLRRVVARYVPTGPSPADGVEGADLLGRVRRLFLYFSLASLAGALFVVLGARQVSGAVTLAGVAGIAHLVVSWLFGYRRGRFPLTAELADAVALFAVCVAAGEPARVVSALYMGLYFRSLYGSRAVVASRVALYAAAYVGAVAVSAMGEPLPSPALAAVIGFPFPAGFVYSLGHLSVRYEERSRRDQVLGGTATALMAATTAAEAHAVALVAACQLTGTDSSHALVVVESGDAMRMVAGVGGPAEELVGRELPHQALPAAYLEAYLARRVHRIDRLDDSFQRQGLGRQQLRDEEAVAAPLVVGEDLHGVLVVSAPSLPNDIEDAVAVLASQLSLALRRLGLVEEVQAREERFRSLVEHASDLIVVTDADRQVTYASESVERLLGYRPDQFVARDCLSHVHPEDRPAVEQHLKAVSDTPGASVQFESRARRADGTWATFEATLTNLLETPGVGGMVVNAHDITERRALEYQLRHQAFHDALTGLPNRALFPDRLEHALGRSGRTGEHLAVLFVDLDDFKTVNDALGHDAGDTVLQEVGRVLTEGLGELGTVARLGGDEFAVLVEDLSGLGDALALGSRAQAAVNVKVDTGVHEVQVAASVGVVVHSGPSDDASSLMRDADLAMYQAKAQGKNRFEVFRDGMRQEVQERLALKADIGGAIEAREFEVHYQPISTLDTREVVAVEALVRWRHPDRGLLAPSGFIPLAEETGQIIPIGRHVLRAACRQLAPWREANPSLTCAVNLSTRQLQDPGILTDVEAALADAGLPPRRSSSR